MNRHWEAQTRNHSLVMVNVRFTTQRRAPAVDAGLCFCLDINKRRKRVEPTEHLAKPHPPPQQRLAGCSDSSLSPSLSLGLSTSLALSFFSHSFFSPDVKIQRSASYRTGFNGGDSTGTREDPPSK